MTAVRESISLYLNAESHRQTDIGWLPVDWDVMPFESIAKIERGKFTARPRNDPRLYGGEFPFIQTGDVANSNGFVRTFSQTLNSDGLKVSKWFPKGTLFFTIAANIGDVALSTFGTAAPDSLVAITPYHGICKNWLIQELRAKKSLFEGLASHNAQANINLEKLNPVLLPVPPLAEQEAIASALGDADALIESLEQLLAKKRLIKQGAMQELLTGKRRLPGFGETQARMRTDFGTIPKDWETKRLPEVARFRSGKAHEQNIVEDGPFICVNSKFISSDGKVAKYSDRAFCLASKNDVLMVMSDLPNGKALAKTYLVESDNRYTVNQRVCALSAYADDGRFLYYALNRHPYFLKFDDGVTQTHLLNDVFLKCPVFLPPTVDERNAIADTLVLLDNEISQVEKKLSASRQLKQGMMQQLLTGRIRLV